MALYVEFCSEKIVGFVPEISGFEQAKIIYEKVVNTEQTLDLVFASDLPRVEMLKTEMESHLHQHLLSESHCCSLFMTKLVVFWQNNKRPLRSVKYHASSETARVEVNVGGRKERKVSSNIESDSSRRVDNIEDRQVKAES
ncbi:hypothetical protein H5410_055709 [Solanum commersonii]|uniref:Uncharacterized protein n=1 Tax=Solanum commersonii TaxID=4109 RepID=A0A9J5WJX6_SOLCO|nr:hypothetical protein H5410_055709 [Solanum commersonii]